MHCYLKQRSQEDRQLEEAVLTVEEFNVQEGSWDGSNIGVTQALNRLNDALITAAESQKKELLIKASKELEEALFSPVPRRSLWFP